MRCFYHQDKEAVGQCRYCGKGLCPECTADLDAGLACRNRCEDKVRSLIQMIERNLKASENPTKMQLVHTGKFPAKALTPPTPISETITVRLDHHIRQTYRFKLNVAASYAAIGVLLFAGGIAREILFLTCAGVCSVGFGIYTFIEARKPAPSKFKDAKAEAVKPPKPQ